MTPKEYQQVPTLYLRRSAPAWPLLCKPSQEAAAGSHHQIQTRISRNNTGNRSLWSFLCRWPSPISRLRPPEQRRGMGILAALAVLGSRSTVLWVHSEEKHLERAYYRPCLVCGHVLSSAPAAPHHSTTCLNTLWGFPLCVGLEVKVDCGIFRISFMSCHLGRLLGPPK